MMVDFFEAFKTCSDSEKLALAEYLGFIRQQKTIRTLHKTIHQQAMESPDSIEDKNNE